MDLRTVPFGTPLVFNACVEIEQGSNLKYEYDSASGLFVLDFTFSNECRFPFAYGFIPETLAGDGDTADVFVISSSPLTQGDVVQCRTIGYIALLDRGQEDDKFIAVPADDPAYKDIREASEFGTPFQETLVEFYRKLAKEKKKEVIISGFLDAEIARERLFQAHERFTA